MGSLYLWIQDTKDAWGNLYELRSILARAHPEAAGVADARRAVSRVINAEERVRSIENQQLLRQKGETGSGISRRYVRPGAKGSEHTRLCHLAALWGEFAGTGPDGSPAPNPTKVEGSLVELAKRYHCEVAHLHRSRHANAILYGKPRAVRVVDQAGRLQSEVKSGGVALKTVFRDRQSGERYFRVEFKHSGGKRCFEADLPVDCDLGTVELPKPKPAPACPPPAPQAAANLDLLSKLAFHRGRHAEGWSGHDRLFRDVLLRRLHEASRQYGVRLGKDHRLRFGGTVCSGWSRNDADWDVEWGVSLLDVDLVESVLHARFDTPSGQQFATIPLSEIMDGIRPARKIIDGLVMMPSSEISGRLYIARKSLPEEDSSPWVLGRSIDELRDMGALERNERRQNPIPRKPKSDAPGEHSSRPPSGSSFDGASAALRRSIFG